MGLRSRVATAVAAALPLTPAEKEALRWSSITGYNEAQSAARRVSARNGTVKSGTYKLPAKGIGLSKGSSETLNGNLGSHTNNFAVGTNAASDHVFSAPVSADMSGKINGQIVSGVSANATINANLAH